MLLQIEQLKEQEAAEGESLTSKSTASSRRASISESDDVTLFQELPASPTQQLDLVDARGERPASPVSVLSSMTYTVDSLERKNVVTSARVVTSQKVATKKHELRRVNGKTGDAGPNKENVVKSKSGLRAPAPVTSHSNVRKTPTSVRKQVRGRVAEDRKSKGGLMDYPLDESALLEKSRKNSDVDDVIATTE